MYRIFPLQNVFVRPSIPPRPGSRVKCDSLRLWLGQKQGIS